MNSEPLIVQELRMEEKNGKLKDIDKNPMDRYNNIDFLRLAINNSLDSFFLIDRKKMIFIDVNKTACISTGFSKKELLSMGPQDIKPEFTKNELSEKFDKVLDGKEKKAVIETVHKRKDGRTFPVEVFLSCLKDENIIIASVRDITDRITAKKKAEENKKSFETIFNSVNDAIFIHDLKGNFLEVNDTACKSLGYSRDELLKMTPKDIDSPKYAKMVDKRISQLKKEGQTIFEVAHIKKDGKEIPVELNTRTIKYKGKPAIISVARDISERKKAEMKIKENEKELRDFFDNANDLIQSIDSKGHFKYVNKKWKKVMGYSDNDLKNLHFTDILREDYVSHCNKIFYELSKGKSFNDIDVVFKTKNGKEIFVNGNLNSKIVDGKFVSTRGIFRDVTKNKKIMQELVEANKKYSTLVEKSNDGIIIVQDKKFIFANKALSKITGFSIDELTGMNFLGVVSDDEKEKLADRYKKRLKGGNVPDYYKTTIVCKNGELKTIELSATLIDYKENPAILAIIRDISEREVIEEKLRESETLFRTLVEQSTVGVYIHDPIENKMLYANPLLKKIFGVTNESIENIDPFKFLHPDDAKLIKRRIKKNFSGEYINPCIEVRVFPPNNEMKWIRLYTSFIDYKRKKVALATVIDISKRKKFEESLKKTMGETDRILNAAGDGIRIIDKNFKVINMNQTMAQMAGVQKKDAIGMNCRKMFGSDGVCGTKECSMEKVLKNKKGFHTQNVRKTVDGKKIPCLHLVTPYLDNNGEIVGIIEDFRDISEIKEKEGELKEKIDELERWKKVTVGRELKMKELKEKINQLENKK